MAATCLAHLSLPPHITQANNLSAVWKKRGALSHSIGIIRLLQTKLELGSVPAQDILLGTGSIVLWSTANICSPKQLQDGLPGAALGSTIIGGVGGFSRSLSLFCTERHHC